MDASLTHFFNKNGYLILKDFFTPIVIENALDEYKKLIRSIQASEKDLHFFASNNEKDEQNSDRYFFDSADQIRLFYNSAAKTNPHLFQLDLSIEENLFSYLQIMNKIGHNLHGKNQLFHDLFFKDPRLVHIAKSLGYDEPCTSVFQTTVISKSLTEDSQYRPHQDGSYLGSGGKVLAYWIPLTPSRKDNGCLWGIPGSHHTELKWWYRKQNKDTFHCHYTGQEPHWNLAEKVDLEVNPGDLLIFSGKFVHGSSRASKPAQNIQDLRIALTYHMGPTTGWDELIWLKLNEKNTLPIYKNRIYTIT